MRARHLSGSQVALARIHYPNATSGEDICDVRCPFKMIGPPSCLCGDRLPCKSCLRPRGHAGPHTYSWYIDGSPQINLWEK
jgi:hypothetical protein